MHLLLLFMNILLIGGKPESFSKDFNGSQADNECIKPVRIRRNT